MAEDKALENENFAFSKSLGDYSFVVEDTEISLAVIAGSVNGETSSSLSYHSHNYFELFLPIDGSIEITTKSGIVTLYENDIAIVPCGFVHYKKADNSQNWATVPFLLKKRSFRSKATSLFDSLNSICAGKGIHVFRNIPKICEHLRDFCKYCAAEDHRFAGLYLISILSEIYTSDSLTVNSDEDTILKAPNDDIDRSLALEQLIETKYLSDTSEETVAHALCVSKRQLSRIIKKHYGKTFREVIISKRLAYSAHLLIYTDMTVEKICDSARFGSVSHFYKKFCEEYKISPGKYREKFKKQI